MKFNTQLSEYIANTNSSRKKKSFEKMIKILEFIDTVNLTESEHDQLEEELSSYKLSEHNSMSNRAVNKKFRLLQRFVIKNFNFTHKGYYMTYFMALGMTLGLSIGVAVFDPTIGLSTGMMIGLFVGSLIGRVKDQKAEKNKLVYTL